MNSTKKASHGNDPSIAAIRDYWNEHIHDLEIARHPVGSAGFFQELADYRYEKLHYLPLRVDFTAYREREVLEVGCGVGIDLARFARGGARVTGIDLAETSIELARNHFRQQNLTGTLRLGNGEALEFPADTFDLVYAHGVVQYTADPRAMTAEIHRVLKPGGTAIVMVYNRRSWLNVLSKTLKVGIEHRDAPVLRTYSRREFKELLAPFGQTVIVPERFPVRSRLQKGTKAVLFNHVFVPLFNLIPRPLTRWSGWHLLAFAKK